MSRVDDVLSIARLHKSQAEADVLKDMYFTENPSVIVEFCDAVIDLLEKHPTVELLKEQEKLVNVDKLRERLGFAESCDKCKKNSWKCHRDTYFSEKDFCERLDIAIEELMQEGR